MKKRILSLLMSFVMLVSLLPASVLAAETVTEEISSAKEFAEMDASGSYKLTQDIEVTTPYKSTFRGTFDGDGHTVTLKLNVTSGNAGLFATTGRGAVIKNVEVTADVTSSVGGTSVGTAGLVGVASYPLVLENCGVSEEHVAKFSVDYDSTFGFDAALHPKNIIDSKHFQVQTPDAVIRVDPSRADMIETRVIGGIKYILIPADETVEVNGVNVHIGQEEPASV